MAAGGQQRPAPAPSPPLFTAEKPARAVWREAWGFLVRLPSTPRGWSQSTLLAAPSPSLLQHRLPGRHRPSAEHVKPSSASWSLSWRSTGPSGHWTPREGRGGGSGEKYDTEALLANSKDRWEGITHVLIYSTSSITLLLLLTPGDLFNCFKSQYCHFIIPRLPLLLIRKEKEGEEEAA